MRSSLNGRYVLRPGFSHAKFGRVALACYTRAMSRASVLMLVGALAIITPFSGLPSAIRTMITVGLGAAVIGIGVAERSREQHRLVAAQSGVVPEPPARAPEPAPEPMADVAAVYMPEPVPAAPAAYIPPEPPANEPEPQHHEPALIPDMQPSAAMHESDPVPMSDIRPASAAPEPAHNEPMREPQTRARTRTSTTRRTRAPRQKKTATHA